MFDPTQILTGNSTKIHWILLESYKRKKVGYDKQSNKQKEEK